MREECNIGLSLTSAGYISGLKDGVYMWKRGAIILYVGSSANPLWRVARHNIIGRVEPLQAEDEILIIPSDEAIILEAELIRTYKPRYNPERPDIGAQTTEHQCPSCQRLFMQKRPHQRWCSTKCRQTIFRP